MSVVGAVIAVVGVVAVYAVYQLVKSKKAVTVAAVKTQVTADVKLVADTAKADAKKP